MWLPVIWLLLGFSKVMAPVVMTMRLLLRAKFVPLGLGLDPLRSKVGHQVTLMTQAWYPLTGSLL